MKEELLKGLTKEQIAKIKACKNQEEMLKVAKEEGVELTNNQLEAISGGCGTHTMPCPGCGSRTYTIHENVPGTNYCWGVCNSCGTSFKVYLD